MVNKTLAYLPSIVSSLLGGLWFSVDCTCLISPTEKAAKSSWATYSFGYSRVAPEKSMLKATTGAALAGAASTGAASTTGTSASSSVVTESAFFLDFFPFLAKFLYK